MTKCWSLLLLLSIFVAACTTSKSPKAGIEPLLHGTPTGQEILDRVGSLDRPFGAAALEIYERLRQQSFEENQQTSDKWIRDHLAHYDAADSDYQAYMREMVEGSPEGSLSMRRWLTDPTNVATWDRSIRQIVGDDGYARLIALNAAFPPGSGAYRLVFGGSRRYDAHSDSLSLNGTVLGGPNRKWSSLTFSLEISHEKRFRILTELGDAVRQQMFQFYADQAAGRVTDKQLRAFNRAYLEAGGCAISNTDSPTQTIASRYLAALQRFGSVLTDVGYRVSVAN